MVLSSINNTGNDPNTIFKEDLPIPTSGRYHAPTITETPAGLVAAFLIHGGSIHSSILFTHQENNRWKPCRIIVDGTFGVATLPCWNPVLSYHASSRRLLLFFKKGKSPQTWQGMLTASMDNGKTWEKPVFLSPGFIGPAKNKPLWLDDHTLLCATSSETDGYHVHLEICQKQDWQRSADLDDPEDCQAIQPAILRHPGGRIQLLCRTARGFIATAFSQDQGQSWSPLGMTFLPNPDSGIDAVSLQDGRCILVYNHSGLLGRSKGVRCPLNLAVSNNHGLMWQPNLTIESQMGQYSYPSVLEGRDSCLHIVYAVNQQMIRYAKIPVSHPALQENP